MRPSFAAVAPLLALWSIGCSTLPETATSAGPLNILLITSDDLGLQLGCYGETRIETPHLDGLASEGVRFETAYVAQASCSPSRSAMFTGLYVHATGQYGLANRGFQMHREMFDRTLPNLLKHQGYRTGIIGKLHVKPEQTFEFDMRETNYNEARRVGLVAERASRFFADPAGSPFFLMVNYTDPHVGRRADGSRYFPPQVDGFPENPVEPSEKTLLRFQRIDTPEQRQRTADYLSAVRRLDDGVGLLLAALGRAGRSEDTLVVFVSDHGPPFARGKTTAYEAGLRIPYIVRWPGLDFRGDSPAMVSTVDLVPTILEAAQAPIPDDLHGRSLRPLLGGDPGVEWRRHLVGEFHYHGVEPFYPRRAIRDERFQLIHNLRAGQAKPSSGIDGDPAYSLSQEGRFVGTDVRRAFDTFADPPEYELYDLAADPEQFHNLAGETRLAEEQRRLTVALQAWQAETDDPFRDPEFVQHVLETAGPAADARMR
ncbi:MAG: sulfatase [Bryobacterales bacterium]|nr:sulfatase [Bryobacterales bacterium]